MPFSIARIGDGATVARTVDDAPTSHVDLVPTLLAAAGIDEEAIAAVLRESFTEVHPLPGRNLMPVVDGAPADTDRPVYLMTRDNMLEGDSGASGLARRLGRAAKPPAPLRIQVPAHVASNFEGLVVRVADARRWVRPPVEAGAHLRRPGDLDRTRRASTGVERCRRRHVPYRCAARPVGAVRPRRRPDRGGQPVERPGGGDRCSPT